MILIVDNYDSFTYNIAQYFLRLGCEVLVKRNNEISLDEIKRLNPSHLVLSPGPGRPDEAGICLEVIKEFKGLKPILGICLGHQAIGQFFGANIIKAKNICHGKIDEVAINGVGIFEGLPPKFKATRYHSLVIEEATLSSDLEITARTSDNEIMGVRHKNFAIEGVQFHPESIGSEYGMDILNNFIKPPNPLKGAYDEFVKYKFLASTFSGEKAVINSSNKFMYSMLEVKAKEMRKNPTTSEKTIWDHLNSKKLGYKFRQQHVVDKFIVDFLCVRQKLAIEIDGKIHDGQIERDKERDIILNNLGINILRFTNDVVINNIDYVVDVIKQKLNDLNKEVPL